MFQQQLLSPFVVKSCIIFEIKFVKKLYLWRYCFNLHEIFVHEAVKVPKLSYFKVKISEAISQTKIFEKIEKFWWMNTRDGQLDRLLHKSPIQWTRDLHWQRWSGNFRWVSFKPRPFVLSLYKTCKESWDSFQYVFELKKILNCFSFDVYISTQCSLLLCPWSSFSLMRSFVPWPYNTSVHCTAKHFYG
jgi:hypothetical protein